ncbi:MAG: ribonuclease P protein component [Chloroflexi bacterium]|nr:ribonuclease P protein component [Chloroflexota bacterium]
MRKPWSLARREQFACVFRQGSGYPGSLVVLRVLRNGLDTSRLGLVVGKKVGGAVQRNRAKRFVREAVSIRALEAGWDVVVIARPGIQSAEYQDVERELQGLLLRAGVLSARGEGGHCRDKGVPENDF